MECGRPQRSPPLPGRRGDRLGPCPRPAAETRSVTAQLAAFDSLVELGSGLDEDQWHTASECPGWAVRDNFVHVFATESMFLNRAAPDVDVEDAPHLKNPIAKINEQWIIGRRSHSAAEVFEEFTQVVEERRKQLEAMTDEQFDEVGFTPAGEDTHGRFLQVRVFDCWIHEQDCRGPLDMPGHHAGPAVEVALDELTTAMGYLIGKKAGAAAGQSVRLELTGEASRVIDVAVDGRAEVVDDLAEPTTTLRLPTELWFRWAAGRRPGDIDHPDLTVEGDRELAQAVVDNAAYTI